MAVDFDDAEIISAQLARPARGKVRVEMRCHLDLPVVARVPPLLEDGTPFPTLYWLTCPLATKRVSRIEAAGGVASFALKAEVDPEFAARLKEAHELYEAERAELLASLPASDLHDPSVQSREPSGGVGGVGKPSSVKCLHAHLAHTLGGGDNPVGQEIAREVLPLNCEVPCVAGAEANPSWKEPEPVRPESNPDRGARP